MQGSPLTTIECTRRGRLLGDPSGEAALAPLKGELAARTGCLRGFLAQLTNPSASRSFGTSPSRGGKGTSCQQVAKTVTLRISFTNC